MTAGARINGFLERYGQTVTLFVPPSSRREIKAFVQPFLYKDRKSVDRNYGPEGYADSAYYIYIGPAAEDLHDVQSGGWIYCMDGGMYNVARTELVYFGGDPCYCWAVLERRTV